MNITSGVFINPAQVAQMAQGVRSAMAALPYLIIAVAVLAIVITCVRMFMDPDGENMKVGAKRIIRIALTASAAVALCTLGPAIAISLGASAQVL